MAEGRSMDACTPRPKKGGGTWWHRVGSAWVAADGKITLYLDSYPLPDKERGSAVIMLFEKREQGSSGGGAPSGGAARSGTKRPAAGGRRDEIDDEIPF